MKLLKRIFDAITNFLFSPNSKTITIYAGKAVIPIPGIDADLRVLHVEWPETEINFKKDEMIVVGADGNIKAVKIKDFYATTSEIILYKADDWVKYI